ncbi:MAG TPA: LLM class flavin-dependent oxidoreductase, partial [Candidatus Binataceae bacterium]|nr:LLM class flavin-dependent oxidoreductase [Candidatus Binataceae bacterium]
RSVYMNALEQVRLADELGFHSVWAVEHHFLEEYSHSSAPDLFLTACAMQTKRIRVGHGVVACVPQYQSPIRIAERAAVLDILTGGRVELGTGRAVTLQELDGFEVNPDDTQAMWAEAVEVLVRAWKDDYVEFKGRFYNIPKSYVVPKPVQKPHPPMWLAGTNPETFTLAGRKGLGMLGFVTGTPEEVAPRIAGYKEAVKHAEPVADFVNDQSAVLIQTYCAESHAQAVEDVTKPLDIVAQLGAELFLPWAQKGQERKAESYKYLTQQARAGAMAGDVEQRIRDGIIAVGTPSEILKLFRKYREMGVDQMLTWVQFGGLEHSKIMRSMELIGKHVLPELNN